MKKNLAKRTPRYVMILRSVGNPDFQQFAPISEPAAIKGDSLIAMVQAAEEYREFWNLGSGNWVRPEVRCEGKPVAWISYNGRLWDSPKFETAREIHDL